MPWSTWMCVNGACTGCTVCRGRMDAQERRAQIHDKFIKVIPGSGGPSLAQAMIDVYRQDAGSDVVKFKTTLNMCTPRAASRSVARAMKSIFCRDAQERRAQIHDKLKIVIPESDGVKSKTTLNIFTAGAARSNSRQVHNSDTHERRMYRMYGQVIAPRQLLLHCSNTYIPVGMHYLHFRQPSDSTIHPTHNRGFQTRSKSASVFT